ncbi:MAG: CocE/NonD family hydrolase [Immundisolibacteraceae bacterium]|nr:CocE/NonD family hydrolase [Immundisolibacteraceae bacterium]
MSVIVDKNIAITMRDGVVLKADIYRPADGGCYPVLIQRTPYNKELWLITAATLDPVRAATAGYAVVIQDVRGRWASAGDVFFPYRDEVPDCEDTLSWAAEQSWSAGVAGNYGLSYMGGTTWMSAATGHDSLRAISPTTAPNSFWRNNFWRGGALQISTLVIWALRTIGPVALFRAGKELPELGARLAELADAVDAFDEIINQRPLDKLAAGHKEDDQFIPFLYEVLRHPLPDEWTDKILLNDRHNSVEVPALIIAGWYDLLLGADLEHFAGMQKNGGNEVARNNTRIVIGPWSHAMFMNMVGQVDFGFRSSGLFLDMKEDLTSLNLRWFDRWLKDEANGVDNEPRVKVFVQGINRWRDEEQWPPARCQITPWYLGNNATFSMFPDESGAGPDSFVYDPEDPCPTCGGTLLMPSHYTPGPVDQSPILGRRDLLVYTSDVLTEDLELAGPVTAQLYASTSAVDTDWVIKLCDLRPDGSTYNVCDGVIRASFQAHETGQSFSPGEVVKWNIDLLATAMVFQAGHRLRVIVSSSDFPRYDRNPNTGEQAVSAVKSVSALQRIFHDEQHPSQLLLPVVS